MPLRIAGMLAVVLLAACSGPDSAGESGTEAKRAAGASADRVFDMPYLMRELDNGLRVIIVPTDYPDIVSLQIPVQTGARNEVEEGKSGFAHFFEHMMSRGTDNYSSAAYTEILKKAGANTNASTADDFTRYYITFTRPDLEKMIEIEADRFQNLAYSESDFRTEALAVNGEYLKNYSNAILKAFQRVRELSFSVHPYHHTTIGLVEDIEAMPNQYAYSREFFDRWYRPEYTSIIIVGDVEPEATLKLVEQYWGNWEPGTFAANIPREPDGSGPLYEHIQWHGETEPWLFLGFRSPAFVPGENDFPAMSVLGSVYFSDSSDLYQDLVIERQLADRLLIDFPFNKDPNLNLIYVRLTEEADAAEVERAVLQTLARASVELIDERKLTETKMRARYEFTANLDNSHSIGRMLADYVQFDRTPETVNQLYATYGALSAADVRDMARKHFTDQTRVTVSISNASEIAGLGSDNSLDALVAGYAGDGSAPATVPRNDALLEETFPVTGDAVPLSIVAMQSDSSPLVDVSIQVHAGAALDPAGKKGLAALTAAMLTDGGSATWSIQEINDAMHPIASGFSARVDKEMTTLAGQVHKDNLDSWYRYVRSQLLNPGWSSQDFARVQSQLVNAIRADLVGNNDEELAKEVLYARIYGPEHPYGSLNLGHSGDIEALSIEDVKAFYNAHYTVDNVTLGVAGGYPDTFLDRLSADLRALPRGEREPLDVPAVADIEGSRVTIIEKETPAVAVSFGFPLDIRRGDPDWVALWLARSWLGEHRSENSHLYQVIRQERGMNYGNYAYIEYFPRGMNQMMPDTNLGRQQQIFQVWIRPLRSNNDAHFATRAAVRELGKLIDDGMSESDFEATRAFLSKFASLLADGQSRQLGYALDSHYYGIDGFADYVRTELAGLTLADVNRVIRENLRIDNMDFVFVTRDAGDLRSRLIADSPSPVSYDAEKSRDLLDEDQEIGKVDLGITEDRVQIVPANAIFH